MSYILDALKKSEAERTRDTGPTLLSTPQHASRGRSGVTTVLIAVLTLNAVIVAAWLLAPRFTASPSPEPVATATGQDRPEPAPAMAPASEPVPQVRPAQASLAGVEARPAPPPTRQANPASKPRVIAPPSPPTFEISTHVYADDAEFRAITVDGKRLTEGDQLANGWTLAMITETGVVVERDGERVVMDVLQDWRE
jgi:general secretion pathway protein B